MKIGLPTLLFLLFLTLKLLGKISWSWVCVTSPLWISVGLTLVFLGIVAIVGVVAALGSK